MKKSIEQVIYEKFWCMWMPSLSGFRLSVSDSFGEAPSCCVIHAVDERGMVLGEVELSDGELSELKPITKYEFSVGEVKEYAEAMFLVPNRCKRMAIPENSVGTGKSVLEVSASPAIEEMAHNDKLLRVMTVLSETFPEEYYSDISGAAKSVLAALGVGE